MATLLDAAWAALAKAKAKRELTPYERAIQDADMPRCPYCRKPLKAGEDMACIQAHGMIALVHEACRTLIMAL